MRRVRVLGDLTFDGEPEVSLMEAAVDYLLQRNSPALGRLTDDSLFACPWVLPRQEAAAVAAGVHGAVARSRPQRFFWLEEGHHKIGFDVHLVVASPHGTVLTLEWEALFCGDVLQEEADYVEVELSGGLLIPSGKDAAPFSPSATACTAVGDLSTAEAGAPSGLLEVEGGYGPAGGGFGLAVPAAPEEQRLREALASGRPLTGLIRVLFRSMGEEQPVTPAAEVGVRAPTARPAEMRRRLRRTPFGGGAAVAATADLGGFDEDEFEQFLSVAHGSFRRID